MTIAHLSDTHLGFRAYGRVRADGANVRETDVLDTFRTTLSAIAARDPDLVIHAGDLFHVVRPPNLSLIGAYRALEDFQKARRGKPLVILGGNHDVPRAGIGGILPLLTGIQGVHVIEREIQTLDLGFVRVVGVPSVALKEGMPALEPPPGPAVLTLHGMSRQAMPYAHGEGDFDTGELEHDRWTYVALGDYHVFQPYGSNVCYAGSTDFASTNVWEESRWAKGWVWFDDRIGKLEFVSVETRPVLDLLPIDAHGLDYDEVEAAMLAAAEKWPEDPKPIVRQRIINASPGLRARIRASVVRELSNRALSYGLTVITSVRTATTSGVGMSLEDSWRAHVGDMKLPAGLTAEALEVAGLDRLREATEDDSRLADA